jgi:alpha-amylase
LCRYSPDFVKTYIEAAQPDFAVGEYWDACSYGPEPECVLEPNQDEHRQRIVDWIDGTGGLSSAFDFTTKGVLQVKVPSCF